MLCRLWDFIVESLMVLFMPAVCSYHLLTEDLFLNVAAADAVGCEKAANALLLPFQYLFAGKVAMSQPDGSWIFIQKHDYNDGFWIKTAASSALVIPSFVLGSAVKGLSYLSESSRKRHASLASAKMCTSPSSNLDLYRQWGIAISDPAKAADFIPPRIATPSRRRKTSSGREKYAPEVASVLNEAKILWWADCGTCLGVYRYGGVIPWDDDIDIGILVFDFENARRAFNRLDPLNSKSKTGQAETFPIRFSKSLKKKAERCSMFFVSKSISKSKKSPASSLLMNRSFFQNGSRSASARLLAPASFDTLFPLKKAFFDGIEVFVPNQTKEYLQRLYGENLDPVKIYDPNTGCFEKDLSHPYWQTPYVH